MIKILIIETLIGFNYFINCLRLYCSTILCHEIEKSYQIKHLK